MRVRIQSTRQKSGELLVDFLYANGRGTARWSSKVGNVACGQDADVELDVDAVIRIGVNCWTSETGNIGVSVDEDGFVRLLMAVEHQDDDGLIYGRLGRDCLVMIESNCGERLVIGSRIDLRVQPNHLTLTAI